uniref:Uncharacterized protein n=1 Tax=Phage sp. ctcqm2 TaxID=2828007 RepID=A0A8S5SSX2_9VIRU|nr:MAG TPA: hypothetical protein [Phage sp. ctcqm2]
MGPCAVLPVDNGRLIHVDFLGNPVVGHSSLRLNASEVFRKTQNFPPFYPSGACDRKAQYAKIEQRKEVNT